MRSNGRNEVQEKKKRWYRSVGIDGSDEAKRSVDSFPMDPRSIAAVEGLDPNRNKNK